MDCPSTSLPYSCPPSVPDCPPPHYAEHEAKFDVQVRVQRSFSFEELQSGSYFASLDESDLQFYRVYGQPVLIPSPDEADGNFVVQSTYPHPDLSCESSLSSRLHFDYLPALTSKSYTLQNPLGEGPAGRQRIYSAPQLPTGSHDWQLVKQEPREGGSTYYNPSLPAISCQLHTLPDQDDDASPLGTSMRYTDDHKPPVPLYDEPPMDSLPYPPPANAASPPYFQLPQTPQATQDGIALGSSSFIHEASFQMSKGREQWEDTSVPSQSYMLSELPQQYPSPATRSRCRPSRSPSPHSPLRMSPVPHSKRSLDKKPALACLFCRGRKIACGPPQLGSKDKTCNQCARRHLKCEYPLESRRGMRKRRSLIPRTPSTTPEINPDGPRVNVVKSNRKRSLDKSS